MNFTNADLGVSDDITGTAAEYGLLREAAKSLLKKLYDNGTPLTIVYCLEDTLETPLDNQEIDNYIRIFENGLIIASNSGNLPAQIAVEYQKSE